MSKINKLLIHLMKKMPDLITGKTKEYEKELYLIYGQCDKYNMVFLMKFNNFKRYIMIIISFILALILFLTGSIFNNQEIISIGEDGHKYIERPTYDQGNISTNLIISGNVDGDKLKRSVTLNIKPEGADSIQDDVKDIKVNLKEEVIGQINSLIYSINKSDDLKKIYLPENIEGMDNVLWKRDKDNPMLLIGFIMIGLLIATYLNRYNGIRKLKKECNESIEEELPDFINKMVLLMNAGLVLSAAFEKIVNDYNNHVYKNKTYFYIQLSEINNKVIATNSSMVEELKRFAERSKNREFMRICNVLSDNIHKGTELVHILQVESGFLWFQRKKRAEEKGRIAETKLTLPLALQLIVLIIITLAPAMIEM